LPAEASGIITLKAEEGDAVEVGQVVCLIDTSAEAPAGGVKQEKKVEAPKAEVVKPTTSTNNTYATGSASPAAKKILAEKGMDASAVSGSGRDGRVTKEDAVKAVPAMGKEVNVEGRGTSRSKMSMLRRKVAERLVEAKNTTAMLTTFNEVDMSPIFALRKEYKETFKAKHGVSLGFMSFFSLAVVRIRNAETLSFRGIESEVKRLAIRARDGQITVDEMTGGTFTISNGGVFGSMLSTPIINPPQSGILGMHNIVERPVAIDGKVEIRPIMFVALSYDHRIIDGKESVGFLVAVKEALENPTELLMDNDIKKALEL